MPSATCCRNAGLPPSSLVSRALFGQPSYEIDFDLDKTISVSEFASFFKQSCDTVRALGFQGKLCIHPDQIGPANTAFSPTADSIAWSEKIVAAFDEAEKQGVASIQVDGYFVDYPIVDQAQRTLDLTDEIREKLFVNQRVLS